MAGLSRRPRVGGQIAAGLLLLGGTAFLRVGGDTSRQQLQIIQGEIDGTQTLPHHDTAALLPRVSRGFRGAECPGGDHWIGLHGPAAVAAILALQEPLAQRLDALVGSDIGFW
ncbi:MAG: hypothetical protein CME04_03010 [Gemmatimonadaceae bacterium]|nr:hypothetical protein [Gemmatimonadaceae bacterium]